MKRSSGSVVKTFSDSLSTSNLLSPLKRSSGSVVKTFCSSVSHRNALSPSKSPLRGVLLNVPTNPSLLIPPKWATVTFAQLSTPGISATMASRTAGVRLQTLVSRTWMVKTRLPVSVSLSVAVHV